MLRALGYGSYRGCCLATRHCLYLEVGSVHEPLCGLELTDGESLPRSLGDFFSSPFSDCFGLCRGFCGWADVLQLPVPVSGAWKTFPYSQGEFFSLCLWCFGCEGVRSLAPLLCVLGSSLLVLQSSAFLRSPRGCAASPLETCSFSSLFPRLFLAPSQCWG